MGQFTNIPWCDGTWNPIRGCDKVSLGCKNCYIVTTPVFRFGKQKHGDPRVKAAEGTWLEPLRWNKKPWVCDECGKRFATSHTRCPVHPSSSLHRMRVFSLSLGDWLDDKIPISWLARMLKTIWECQELEFLLCTKRSEHWAERIEAVLRHIENVNGGFREAKPFWSWLLDWSEGKAPKNIWVLVSVENQEMLTKRVPELLSIPGTIRGLSCEPLLDELALGLTGIDWVIAGGESGTGARPCNVAWMEDIQLQCAAKGVPYFAKQLGSLPIEQCGHPLTLLHPKGGDPTQWREALRVRQFPINPAR